MKIAFLNMSHGLVNRGAEVFVNELSNSLKKVHEVDIYSSTKVVGRRWPVLWRIYLDPFGLSVCVFTLKLLPKLWRRKYDIIVPIDGAWQPALVRVLMWLRGGRVVISGQSGKGWDDRNNLWSFPDRFVALSQWMGDWARKTNPFVNVVVIPNGVDVDEFTTQDAYDFGLPKPVILTVGALTKNKRLDLAIKAVSKLSRGSLVMIGKGEQKSELQQLGNQLLPKRFKILSFPHKKMVSAYQGADLFTFPTVAWESFGIVLVEAMASGLGVVATSDPIRREIVGNAGLFVDPVSTQAYAKALEKALSTNWGDKPIKQAKKFSWDKIANKYEKLFKSLVK